MSKWGLYPLYTLFIQPLYPSSVRILKILLLLLTFIENIKIYSIHSAAALSRIYFGCMYLVHTFGTGWYFFKKHQVLNLRWAGRITAATVESLVSSSSSCAESETGRSLGALSQLLAQQRWNDGTLLHLPTLQPITALTCLTSTMTTPRFLGDPNKGAWTTRGRLIWPLREAPKMYSRGTRERLQFKYFTGLYLKSIYDILASNHSSRLSV